MTIATYANQFSGDYAPPPAVLGKLAEHGWTDDSWRHDVSPKFLSPGGIFRLWVDHPAKDQRETGGARFIFERVFPDAVIQTPPECLAQFETTQAAIRFLANIGKFWVACQRAKAEILADIAMSRVPAKVQKFSELHNHVDANYYGGAFDAEQIDATFWDNVQAHLDRWLKEGRP